MGKLIDVDEMRKYIGLSERCEECDRDKVACQYDQVFTRMDFCGWLDDMPEAVVRCKDCRYQCKGSNEVDAWNLCTFMTGTYIPISDDDFCSYGKRRTDE